MLCKKASTPLQLLPDHLIIMTYFMCVFMAFFGACDDTTHQQASDSEIEQELDLGLDEGLVQDMMRPDLNVPLEDCLGVLTNPECLTINGQKRNWRREWQSIPSDSLNWGPSEVLNTTAFFNSDFDAQIPSSILTRATVNGDRTITATSLNILIPDDSSSVEIVIDGLKADRIFQEGYQSWSFAGAIIVPQTFPRDDQGHLYIKEALTGDPLHGEHGISFNVIAGQIGDDGESGVWLLAHVDPSYSNTTFGVEKLDETSDVIRLTARVGFEDIPLSSDQKDESLNEGMIQQNLTLITAPSLWLALRTYQEQMKQTLDRLSETSTRSFSSSSSPQRPPKGWYSWNERFEDIDTAYILEHLDLVAEKLKPFGFDLVEIDDGWQQGWGNWVSNELFPNDFEPIITQANALDLNLGIWFAPFLVEVDVAEENNYPLAWFVHNPHEAIPNELSDLLKSAETPNEEWSKEQVLVHRIVGNPRSYYVLDTTHPEAMAHVLEQLAHRVTQGFSYFKLDFLYAAAIPGKRMEVVSGIESLRIGLAKIREVLGPEVIINACGAPIHAVLGYADSLRIGADTTFGDLYPSFIASAARSTAARAYLFPLVWPDGDQVQTRSPYLTQQAELGSDVAMLSAAAYSIGDDLSRLPQDRLAIFTDAKRLWWSELPQPAIPLNIMQVPAESWVGNPLIDHLQNNDGTAAVPPTRFLGQNNMGDLKLMIFNWAQPFSSQEQQVDVSFVDED